MKYRTLTLLIFPFIVVSKLQAQVSLNLDSSICVNLPNKDSAAFKAIYKYIVGSNLYNRLDSLKYQEVYIEAKKVDTSFSLQEYYFVSDSIYPKHVYYNAYVFTDTYFAKTHDKRSMKKRYSNFDLFQEYDYDKIQVVRHGCIRFRKSNYKNFRMKELKSTSAILVSITPSSNSVKISFQSPPKHPRFRMKFISGGF